MRATCARGKSFGWGGLGPQFIFGASHRWVSGLGLSEVTSVAEVARVMTLHFFLPIGFFMHLISSSLGSLVEVALIVADI